MKKTALLHAELSHVIATMGHGDMLVIGDVGLPVPPGVTTIDLAVTLGVPRFEQVLNTVLTELQVEKAVIAEEASDTFLSELARDFEITRMSHENFKLLSHDARAIVRTGEATPYANVALISGVVF
ncbi:MAG: D-ribose pyranase [Pseudomonadota bacterium]